MKNQKISILIGILIFTIISTLSFAQNVEFDKDNFKNDKEGFKIAVKNLKEGYGLYSQQTKGTYRLALDYLLKANKFNPNNALLNYRIGECYLKSIDKLNSLSYLEIRVRSTRSLPLHNLERMKDRFLQYGIRLLLRYYHHCSNILNRTLPERSRCQNNIPAVPPYQSG